jgi:hypothetical protein
MTHPDADALTPPAGRSLLELVGLSGLTITQPLLATFGDSPDFFVFRQASADDIVMFALVIATVPGLLAWLLSQAVGLVSRRGRGIVHHLALGTFAALGLLQITARSDMSLRIGIPLAVAAGLALVFGRLLWGGLRSWLQWLAPAPVLFVVLFLFVAPVSSLVSGTEVDPAELGTFGSGDPPPVVVMVFDEWPLSSIVRTDGTIDEQLAPNVARLAGSATWYRDTTTVANITNFAVPAILTGNRPEPGDRADASSQPENLFTLLAGNYDLAVKESLTRLCPESLCTDGDGGPSAGDRATQLGDLLGEARGVFTDRLTPGAAGVLVTDAYVEPEGAVLEAEGDGGSLDLAELLAPRPERLDSFLEGMEADEDPTVHYVHVLGPHTPHRHTPSGVRYSGDSTLRLISMPDGSPGSDLRRDVAWPAKLDRQRLLLEVAHVDRLIGDVLDELEEAGLYDDALVVLTSDHGIGFEPGASARGLGDRAVERSIEADLLWVPLLIKAPGQTRGAVDDVPASTIDILPTMAGHLGIDLPWEVDGRDLNDGGAGRAPGEEEATREFVRIAGSSFAVFDLDPPVAIRAEQAEVFARGTDAHLDGTGEDRWWRVGPRPDLVGARVDDLAIGSVSAARHELDEPEAYEDVDIASGDAPLLIAGRIEGDGAARPDERPVAVLVGDVVAAVVPTYDDGTGPGRFAAMLAPQFFEETDGAVRIADVVEQNGEAVLRFIPGS